jgi:hypothetical protein
VIGIVREVLTVAVKWIIRTIYIGTYIRRMDPSPRVHPHSVAAHHSYIDILMTVSSLKLSPRAPLTYHYINKVSFGLSPILFSLVFLQPLGPCTPFPITPNTKNNLTITI